jgi:hypothetical protein
MDCTYTCSLFFSVPHFADIAGQLSGMFHTADIGCQHWGFFYTAQSECSEALPFTCQGNVHTRVIQSHESSKESTK